MVLILQYRLLPIVTIIVASLSKIRAIKSFLATSFFGVYHFIHQPL
jgi:hypothetical protein